MFRSIQLPAAQAMIHVLLLVGFLGAGLCDECEPGFADTCFTSVNEDLKYMLDLKKMTAVNITKAAVHELCLALDDSLNCTADIIDTDCTEEEGKNTFDTWTRALQSAYKYVCQDDHSNLRAILEGIPCWSIEDFFLCTEDYGGLSHVRDLLHTPLNQDECNQPTYKRMGDECATKSICCFEGFDSYCC